MTKHNGLITIFARHPVAANLLMLLIFLVGAFSLYKINTQLLPTFGLKFVTVSVAWPGATATDIERSITVPLEQELRNVDNLKELRSISRDGYTSIILEMQQNVDMGLALDQAKEEVALVRNLPQDSEPPIIMRVINFEPIARLLITSPGSITELRPIVRQFERQLLDRGIGKIEITGLPDQEIAIQVPTQKLAELQLSLNQIGELVRARSVDQPAGRVGGAAASKQLRSPGKIRTLKGFNDLPILTDVTGRLIRLGDIAVIEKRPREDEVLVKYQGKPAVQMQLFRGESASALKAADILNKWLAEIKPTLSQGIHIQVFEENWQYIKDRINLLIKNGLTGFGLILIVLFFFLNRKVAFWVAMGIPISIFAAIGALYLIGGSINMVSLFAFIMTLGIIVDDTIVVGEEALTQMQAGIEPKMAIENAAYRMLPPIMASSLTTISAFIPLMLVRDIIGEILLDIPLVVICVIAASLLECFYVLPGHLRRSFKRYNDNNKHHPIRSKIDSSFARFRDVRFRKYVDVAIRARWLTLSFAAAFFLISIGLIFSGRINFTFFPSPDIATLQANIQFSAGTPSSHVKAFLQRVETALHKTDKQLSEAGQSLIITSLSVENQAAVHPSEAAGSRGSEFAHVLVELTQPDDREVRNKTFIQTWYDNVKIPPGVENFTITTPRTGPPGEDIDVQLTSNNVKNLKLAALDLQDVLRRFQGVTSIKDDMPFGQEQLIYALKPQAKALGLTIDGVGEQLRSAFSGKIVQIFHEPNEEIEVRVMLPDRESDELQILEQLPIITPDGKRVLLNNVVDLKAESSLNILRHSNTELTAHVTAEVNPQITNANKIITQLKNDIVPGLIEKYGVKVTYRGRAEEQQETLTDMKYGLMLALVLIYIILAWVFASYGLPILIMLAIPLGLTGAILGHLIMGIDLTVLSLFGFFGLSGIVINDSIILVRRYMELRESDLNVHDAIVEASCQRLRPVLLTSLTTIAGLTPLLFERSLQAQFLIPMAVSIAFGLAYATVLILIVIPALLSIFEKFRSYRFVS